MKFVLRADQVEHAVRERYANSGNIVLSQVRNGVGFERSPRTADMLIVSTWPSRGLYAEGIEIKVSRSDLLKELSNPAKAEAIAKYCVRWHIACPEGLTDGVEIPETWGVLSIDSKLKASVARQAKTLEPIPMDTVFVCSVLRRFSESYCPLAQLEPRIAAEKEAAIKNARAQVESRLKSLEKAISEFKENSGIDLLDKWGHPSFELRSIAKAVKMIVAMGSIPCEELVRAKQALAASMEAVDVALQTFGGER